MKYISIIKILIFSALLPVLTAVISRWRIDYNGIVIFIAYFFLTIYCIRNYGKEIPVWSILLTIFVGRCLLSLHVIYGYFTGETWSLPHFMLSVFGIVSGFLYLRLPLPFNLLPFLLSFVFAVFMLYQGWNYWIHKYNFGTYTGKVEAYNLPTKFEAIDEQRNLITDDNFQNKIVLLDFWITTCGICFKRFPQLQAAYDKYKNDSSVMILAVNKPIEEDKQHQAFDIIHQEGYSFPVVITKDKDLAEKFGVKGFPATFVISPNGQIVYKGDIEGAVRMINELKSKN